MPCRQIGEQSLYIHAGKDRVFGIPVCDILDHFQADHGPTAFLPMMIDQLVAGDGEKPCRERTLAIISNPPLMQGEKRILNQIVQVMHVRSQPPSEITLQQVP
ncbi:hypothetical protein D3C71_1128720 [compost metagenome]